ncbi:MAG: hypothetical protein JWN23_2251 [Rhodocyclales bacterium]|nr:hypothetical protein [Rhodocyclales bacterium]
MTLARLVNFGSTIVDEHWRDRFDAEPCYASGMSCNDCVPACQLGAQSRLESPGIGFGELEDDLATQYR